MYFLRGNKSVVDYSSSDKSDIFGEKTYFRDLVTKLVKGIVDKGNWFSFCKKAHESQEDIMSVLNNKGKSLGAMTLEAIGYEDNYRVNLYRYLLNDYLCYCEIPSVVKQKDSVGFRDSYSKCLITTNISVIANWLGISYAEAKMFYGGRCDSNDFERDDDLTSYVKLTVSKDGIRKVSKPRKELDLQSKGLRISPLFALMDGIEELYNVCKKGFHDISYIKDSGQERTVNICFDYSELCNIYKDKGLLAGAFEQQFDGRNVDLSQIERGYIRVIEVGTSLKSGPVRSLNIARIIKIKEAKPDLTFIDVVLEEVKDKFLNTLITSNLNFKEFADMLEIFKVGNGGVYNDKKISSLFELEVWVDQQEAVLSTPFLKQLALFMMGNPQWFSDSKPVLTDEDDNEEDFGVDDLDFDLMDDS